MLQLLSLLQTHRYWPGAELADRLEVSDRTLRRDVDRLRDLGYPVDAVRGVAGGYQLQAGAAMPPLLLDDEEAVAIAVGLQAAAGGMVAGIEETSVRALGKVVQVMPPRLRRRVDALRVVHGAGGVHQRRRRPDRSTPTCWPRSRRPAATTSGCGSATAPGPARRWSAPSSRTGWCRWAAAGTSSAGTSPGTTGAASGSTG